MTYLVNIETLSIKVFNRCVLSYDDHVIGNRVHVTWSGKHACNIKNGAAVDQYTSVGHLKWTLAAD